METGKVPTTLELKVRLSPEALDIAKVEALGRGQSVSRYLDQLLRTQPRRFVLTDRGKEPREKNPEVLKLSPAPEALAG